MKGCQKECDCGFEARVRYERSYWRAEVWRDGRMIWDDMMIEPFNRPASAYRRAGRHIRKLRRAIRKGWMT